MDKTNKTITFLTELFGHTEKLIWLQALGNNGGGSKAFCETTLADKATIAAFVARYDVPGTGLYCCVSTTSGAGARTKDRLAEITCLHLDMDFKDILGTATDADKALGHCRLPPSIINNSGNGRHAYWLFKEPLPATPDNQARVEAALKQLADLFAGDMAVTHCAALMRLPGTHNSKHGAWVECETIFNGAVA